MLYMDPVGWIVVGLVAGWLSSLVVHDGQRQGCLANMLIGILGGIVGGLLARELHFGDASGFLGAVIVAFVGAVLVRLVINALSGSPRR